MKLVSTEFLVFFAAVFTAHWLVAPRFRNALLILASYVFYCFWDWRYAGLLFATTCASYLLARAVASASSLGARRGWALGAVILHVGVLAFFKLRVIGADSVDILRGRNVAGWGLPLGLSYYTFQSLGYVLDVFRGLPVAAGFWPYCLFVSFFPQITAGPVGRARHLLPQLQSDRHFDRERFYEGCHLIYWGLFQKVFIADNIRPIVSAVFDGATPASGGAVLLGIYGFTLQLYGDFAGYSNMARGLGKCLGLELAENFRLPFFAQDMQEHWKRWHVSLSEWFADFLYRPFVNLPLGYYKFFIAPLATLFVMGLWHRFSLQMILLGLNYGFWISVTLFIKSWALRREGSLGSLTTKVLPWFNRLLTFHLVCASFVLLRAHSLGQAGKLASRVFGAMRWDAGDGATARRLLFFAGPLLAVECFEYSRGAAGSLYRLPQPARVVIYAAAFAFMLAFGRFRSESFFYSAF